MHLVVLYSQTGCEEIEMINMYEWLNLQSALTGESMPATKKPGDEVFSGSTCKQGEIEAVVIATGVHTFFGKAAHLVDSTNNIGHFQKVNMFYSVACLYGISLSLLFGMNF